MGPIRRKLRIWSHLLKESLMENSLFCAVDGENDRFVWQTEQLPDYQVTSVKGSFKNTFLKKSNFPNNTP